MTTTIAPPHSRRRIQLPIRAMRPDDRHAWERPLPLDPLIERDPCEHLEGPKRWYTGLRVIDGAADRQ